MGLAVALAVAPAGCGEPAGSDGDLVDDWPAFGPVVQFAPNVGDCSKLGVVTPITYSPVDCGQSHSAETFHLGTFTGALAGRPADAAAGGFGGDHSGLRRV
ncbi:hypothetical protein ACL02O_05840 [Micromonospora sp. MS34]|uniref:hypothetical protein n=1 Tax=Micromonospora sp. MS34 TaxID=3385971 RepID=UPI0039A05CA6